MGTAEVAAILSGLCTLLLSVLAFMGRGILADAREHDRRIAAHDSVLAVLQASQLESKVHGHDVRLTAIEQGLADIRSDVRLIRAWVDSQAVRSDHHHRRSGDRKDETNA